jgi:hypothetical protein
MLLGDNDTKLLIDMINALTKTVNQRFDKLESRFDKLEEQNAVEHKQLMQAIKELDKSKLNKDAKFKLTEVR